MDDLERLLGTVDACADRLEELNQKFPYLTSDDLRESVDYWRKVRPTGSIEIIPPDEKPRSDIELVAPEKPPAEDDNKAKVRQIALDLLENNGLEDVLDILSSDYKVDIDLKKLIILVGKENYVKALRQDGITLRQNAISDSQIADLWNDLDRPAFGGVLWNEKSVAIVLD